jgi:Fe-S cluster assembly protein SufD
LFHTRYQHQSAGSFLVTRTEATQSDNSRFHSTGVDMGEGVARHDVRSMLAGVGASCTLNGVCLTGGSAHADHHLEAVHSAKDCKSEQTFRAVADGRSRVVFNGKVHIMQGADGADARQSSAGLLLSAMAEIDAKPELEIYADEVMANHGATVGQLDETAMFYMRSRGLDEEQARSLLTQAFCRSVTDQLKDEAVKTSLGDRLTGRLEKAGV